MLRRFNLATDLATLNAWYAGHGERPMDASCMPLTGFIEPDVAAGFLYKTDSTVGLLDLYVGNPAASARSTRRACDLITERLVAEAQHSGITLLIVLSDRRSILRLAVHHGFTAAGSYVMMRREV